MNHCRTFTFVCFDCRISKKYTQHSDPHCHLCNKQLIHMGGAKTPAKKDDEGWKELRKLYVEYTKLEEKQLEDYYVRNQRWWHDSYNNIKNDD